MKSINRFIYRQPKEVGLNAVFGKKDFGWKYEIIGLFAFTFLWMAVSAFIFTRHEFTQFNGFLPGPTFKALAAAAQDSKFWISVFASLRRIL
ncbi:MAG: ABC transporter permease, partial [Desulfobacteraceae bacterium]|nr:ABC transporter permease [Desulfobacteraceae bacterium]